MKVEIKVSGLGDISSRLSNMQRQIPYAMSRAINKLATQAAKDCNTEISNVFDRPVPRTKNAVKVFKGATKTDLSAIVKVDDGVRRTAQSAIQGTTGKSAIPPSMYLAAEIEGGGRVAKRYERALQSVGVMPSGSFGVFAKRSNSLDQYGNLKGSKISQILSWFQAFRTEGFKANMTKRTKDKLIRGKRKGLAYGFGYFRGGRGTGLPDGIWERHYPNGLSGKSFIRPVIIYVKSVSYKKRFDFYGVCLRTIDEYSGKVIDEVIDQAIATAR